VRSNAALCAQCARDTSLRCMVPHDVALVHLDLEVRLSAPTEEGGSS
jgi:hypothetical protein